MEMEDLVHKAIQVEKQFKTGGSDASGDPSRRIKDPLQMPIGPIARARAKKLQDQ